MKRILILLASVLLVGTPVTASACAYGTFGSSKTFSVSDASEYKLLCDYVDCGLAVDDHGAWGAGCGFTLGNAELSSISECRRHSSKPTTCRVVDLNQQSDFLERKQGSVAITTVGDRSLVGTGTGFVINDDYVVTADHVLAQCNAVSIRHQHKEIDGEIAARDTNNDLGLIRLAEKFESSAKLRDGKPTTLGEMVANYGYPLFGQLSDAAKVTQGNINALAGWQNDSSILQFDAPTQPGNSGGPLLDASANVVGVVSSGLSKEYAIQTDHIAQNVNFAVKSYLLEGFLTANGVTYDKAESPETLSLPKIAEKAETFTVLVGCWQ